MLILYFAVAAIVCSVSAAPSLEKIFDHSNPYSLFGYPYTGSVASTAVGGAYAGAAPFAGSYAAAGFPFFPIPPIQPLPPIQPFTPIQPPTVWVPFPIINIKPWYKGENVCATKKVTSEPQDLPDWVRDAFGSNYNFQESSENCKSDNDRAVCSARRQTPEGIKLEYTLYECCNGYKRSADGCVESSKKKVASDDSTEQQPTGSEVEMNEKYKYNYYKESDKPKSGVEKVPPQ